MESGNSVFEASASQLVQTGYGNAEKIASKIVKNGQLWSNPEAKAWSKESICANFEVGETSWGSPKVLLTGQTLTPTRRNFLVNNYTPLDFSVEISEARDGDSLALTASIDDPEDLADFLALNYDSPSDEEIYGMGFQYTEWNFRGKRVPVVTSEGGIGRGLEPLTFLMNVAGRQGGNTMTTYAPSYSHITSRNRGFIFHTPAAGYLDFSK